MCKLGPTWVALLIVIGSRPAFCEQRIEGKVLTGGTPVPQAIVRIQGQDQFVLSDASGNFVVPVSAGGHDAIYVTAGHIGFYNNRVVWKPGAPVIIELTPLPAQDNSSYEWQEPKPDASQPDNCGNCHTEIFQQWSHDAHGMAASNPLLLTFYTGADVEGHVNRGPGYKRDWNDNGNCGTCHAPVAAFAQDDMMANLQTLDAKQKEGVLCDFCHKIREAPSNSVSPNVIDFHFLRPATGKRLLFGPFSDATFPEEIPDFSYSPLFKSSRMCAACHQGQFWGVPAYDTFNEWSESRYSRADVQCQGCHMKPSGVMDHFTNLDKGGKVRNPQTIGLHSMMGTNRDEFIRQAISMEVTPALQNNLLTLHVVVANTGAGHKFPTGQPIRNLILTVMAADESGKPLRLVSGERVPIWGGEGKDVNDYAGLPGKGFAKVLETLSEYQKVTIVTPGDAQAEFPAPMWRKTRIKSDNRIAPDGEDNSTYIFFVPSESRKITVTSQLIYRRAFKPLADAKHWNLPDLLLRSKSLQLEVEEGRLAETGNAPIQPARVITPGENPALRQSPGRLSK